MSIQRPDADGALRVLRISHSAVVAEWRERERALRRRGVDITLVSAAVWNEGGRRVRFVPGTDGFALSARTWRDHPNAFLFDPRPIWRLLGQGPWDVLDIHEEPCSLATAEVLFLRWLRRRSRPPVVLYSAQNIQKRFPPPFRWFERYALRTVAGIDTCNEEARRILVHKGLRGVAAVVPLGVDVHRFAPAHHARVDAEAGGAEAPADGQFVVGYVGRLDHHKGVHVLLRAAAAMQARVSVEILGDGAELPRLEKQAAEEGIADRVTFCGAVDHGQLAARYPTFDAIVVPSIPTPRWDEQFCRVAVEAMASGVPIVASETGALPEVVGNAGLLVPPDDPAALAAALDRLASEPELSARLRAEGLERSRRFSWDAVADEQLALYRQVSTRRTHPTGSRTDVIGPRRDSPGTEVIVVAYGAPRLLDRCLSALNGFRPTLVIDNSSDPEVQRVSTQHGARYVDTGRNLGFAAGVNRGLELLAAAESDVLLLNPDAVITPEAIDSLEHALADDPALACVAPVQTTPDGEVVRVGWPFPSPMRAWREAIGLARLQPPNTEFVIGSVLLLRRSAINDVGTFDERYFLYAEETDWQRRAINRGWKVRLCPDVEALHVGAGTGGDPKRREQLFHASQEHYVRKHQGRLGWQVYRAAVVAGSAARAVVPGSRHRRARAGYRLRLYLLGPSRAVHR